jgi:uncharacterized membrane protein YeiB
MVITSSDVFHYGLIALVLLLFSKLTMDAIVLGAVAVFLYQKLKNQ